MKNLLLAIDAWSKILSAEFLVTENSGLKKYNAATFHSNHENLAVLYPANAEEVSLCVKVANDYQIPIYPVSRGKNTGYGSRLPANEKAVLIDLSRLNRITAFDQRLGHVTVEPGVTFEQLFAFLRDHQSTFMMSATGAAADASLVANALERGVGKGQLGNRSEYVCNLEVVSATGDIFNASSNSDTTSASAPLMRNKLGPSIDGLFFQSNFGIVTKMTLWLRPIPRYLKMISFKVNDTAHLTHMADKLQSLLQESIVESGFTFFNDTRGLVSQFQLPLETEDKIFTAAIKEKLLQKSAALGKNLSAWNGHFAISAFGQEELGEKFQFIQAELNPFVSEISHYSVDRNFCSALIQKTAAPLEFDQLIKDPQQDRLLNYLGLTRNKDQNTCYWYKATPLEQRTSPEQDGCGLIWVTAAIPFTGDHITEALTLIQPIAEKYHLAFPVTIQCISSRIVYFVIPILFDAEDTEMAARAKQCHHEMYLRLIEQSYLPYRISIDSAKLFFNAKNPTDQYIKKMKQAIDPNNILAPGRYEYI